MPEKFLLTGLIEPTNEPYAIAKIAGIKMVKVIIGSMDATIVSVMPTNSAVLVIIIMSQTAIIPALIRRFQGKINDLGR